MSLIIGHGKLRKTLVHGIQVVNKDPLYASHSIIHLKLPYAYEPRTPYSDDAQRTLMMVRRGSRCVLRYANSNMYYISPALSIIIPCILHAKSIHLPCNH
ncbi:hypothetical protein EYC84_002414 [Monilinia fructicola]|uniref:Uncharacterized protein n=1 Tax=Monilinia fructicola TaxID=38448 RepID=A0A5M9JN42_MONFR|nr:hypothetical protein EYC84_002414 [Monilinia fructicola]